MEDFNNFRLQKISMIVADVLLVVLGVVFAFSGDGPMAPMQFFWVVVSVSLGGILAFIPFFLEYKIRASLAEYDRSQANLENAERIERVLAEIHEIAAAVASQADRSEEAMTKTAETVARLEEQKPVSAGGTEELTALSASVEAMRKDVARALDSVASAEDTAALIGGIEVSLASLSGQLEQVQFQLTKDAAARQHLSDQPPAPESAGDEAVEPSTLEEAPSGPNDLAPGDELPAEASADESISPGEDLLVEEDAVAPEDETAEQQLEGVEDVPEDLPVKDAALDAVVEEAKKEAAADDKKEKSSPTGDEPTFTDARPTPAADSGKVALIEDDWEDSDVVDTDDEPDTDFLGEEEDSPEDEAGAKPEPKLVNMPAKEELDEFGEIELATSGDDEMEGILAPAAESADEELAGSEDVPEDLPVKDAALDAVIEDIEAEEGPSQPNLMEDLPPPRKKARKSPKGATVLVAQVLIGIGNKPYIRGTGPGLSPDKGIPMEFLEIGKWQWTAPEGEGPFSCQIYKNDEVPADGEPVELEPGQRRTVSPSFKA